MASVLVIWCVPRVRLSEVTPNHFLTRWLGLSAGCAGWLVWPSGRLVRPKGLTTHTAITSPLVYDRGRADTGCLRVTPVRKIPPNIMGGIVSRGFAIRMDADRVGIVLGAAWRVAPLNSVLPCWGLV